MPKPEDPHYEREAAKYENPIPSREMILEVLEDADGPLTLDELAGVLHLEEDTQREALRRRLRAMERDGQVVRNRRKGYVPVTEDHEFVRGRVIAHPDGFGFLVPDEGGEDVFLPPREMRALLHGDRALVRIAGIDRRGRREGVLVEVLERAHEEVVGRLFIDAGVGFVAPDNKRITQDILIPPDKMGGAKAGQIVVARLIEQPSRRKQPIGEVVEILGEHMAPGMEIDIAIRAHELPHRWPEAVEQEIAGLGEEVPEQAKQGREDLRDLPLVTIDGPDARDFDDAVYAEPREGGGWRLIVAIADVSAYVQLGSALDDEARLRGNSVYFPQQVIPMLPEVLSNGLCSINPKVDRLCMAVELMIDDEGWMESYRFMEGVMRSHARLTYDQVARMVVERDPELRERHAELVPHLDNLYGLYLDLREAREERGAIDFETTETKFEFDEQRKIKAIRPAERNEAHKIIEECMIAANVAAAKFLNRHRIVALYRVHEGPAPEKVEELRAFLGEFGLHLRGGEKPTPKDYMAVLQQIEGRPDQHLIQTVMLRSLSQAQYSPDPDIGHFGLSLDDYTHFTSPIRRYPDLIVHRAIRHILAGRKPGRFPYSYEDMVQLGEHCSMTERRADEATRDAADWLKCEFMLDKVGEVYTGTISGVAPFGVFLELDEVYVEGMVHVTNLPRDYYEFDPVGHRLVGKHTGRSYRIGDRLEVIVARVDLDEKKIDFEPVETAEQEQKPVKRRRRRKKKTR